MVACEMYSGNWLAASPRAVLNRERHLTSVKWGAIGYRNSSYSSVYLSSRSFLIPWTPILRQ